MKIAIIGQSMFGAEVMKALLARGHLIAIVFTVQDKNGREDVLAQEAKKCGIPVVKLTKWRQKDAAGKFHVIPAVLEEYLKYEVDLNVLPFCTQFIPSEITEAPAKKSIVYHPSLLPAHRGASAINWTLICGDELAGFTIFWPDDGLDTGPILLQRSCKVDENDTQTSLYERFLYPEGIRGLVEAVELIDNGKAPRITQPEKGASYDPHITAKPELAQLSWNKSQWEMHNFIRGNDKVPGAWVMINNEKIHLFSSSRPQTREVPSNATAIEVPEACGGKIYITSDGLLLPSNDQNFVLVKALKLPNGRTIEASKYGNVDEEDETITNLTDAEIKVIDDIRDIWKGILGIDIEDDTDFFASGGTSQDVARLIEDTRFRTTATLQNPQVYMSPTFRLYTNTVIKKLRGGDAVDIIYDKVNISVNGINLCFPHQMFINGKFVDSRSGRTYQTINPTNEQPICLIPKGNSDDVNEAVSAAQKAFENGEWGKISARDRGKLLYKLADLMEEHAEELATLEALDSGAVYTLALKTHVGMSIDAWRYFAGWADKIQGHTIPISEARPNHNLCITVKEPIGVCGLIIPWNYPLMMLSWKMSACLAAGNTVILKPAQVTPLTALKFAELSLKAGIPKGVINVLTGSGSEIGKALCNHPIVRKIGFTGSTEIGAQIMSSCACSNIKKVSLELGGKSPLIIFADADLNRAVKQTCTAVFFNKGENCIAAGRVFVADTIYDDFIKKLIEETKRMVIGDPFDRCTDHGPQNHKAHLEKLLDYVNAAISSGARLIYGGKRVNREGLFFEPTILIDVDDKCSAAIEESFGPIMVISKFDNNDINGVIKRANATEYGLAAGVFSKDVSKVLNVSRKLKAGTVFVNTYQKTDVAAPFGGYKQSGFGKDLGAEALKEYLHIKTITVEY